MPRSVGEARRPSGRSIRLSTGTPERKIVCPQRSDLWSGAVVLHVRHISLRATSGGLLGGVRRVCNVQVLNDDHHGSRLPTFRPPARTPRARLDGGCYRLHRHRTRRERSLLADCRILRAHNKTGSVRRAERGRRNVGLWPPRCCPTRCGNLSNRFCRDHHRGQTAGGRVCLIARA